jgi:hypothetical protein
LEPLITFRVAVARYTLLLASVCAAAAWPFDPNVSKGVLLGGFAGTIGFWITARNMGVLTTPGAEKLELYAFKWALVRLGCYGAAISLAFTFDREDYHGLIGAVAGIFLVQIVMVGRALRGGTKSDS